MTIPKKSAQRVSLHLRPQLTRRQCPTAVAQRNRIYHSQFLRRLQTFLSMSNMRLNICNSIPSLLSRPLHLIVARHLALVQLMFLQYKSDMFVSPWEGSMVPLDHATYVSVGSSNHLDPMSKNISVSMITSNIMKRCNLLVNISIFSHRISQEKARPDL